MQLVIQRLLRGQLHGLQHMQLVIVRVILLQLHIIQVDLRVK
jgi:hypothetical protein